MYSVLKEVGLRVRDVRLGSEVLQQSENLLRNLKLVGHVLNVGRVTEHLIISNTRQSPHDSHQKTCDKPSHTGEEESDEDGEELVDGLLGGAVGVHVGTGDPHDQDGEEGPEETRQAVKVVNCN